MRIALFQPDIPGNTGTILRTAACLGFAVDLIGPAGFDLSDRALRRAGMDYLAMAALTRHDDFAAFDAWRRAAGRRLVLMTTRGDEPADRFAYRTEDIVLFGRESAGVPEAVHRMADRRLAIAQRPGTRSLNLAVAVAMTAAFAADALVEPIRPSAAGAS